VRKLGKWARAIIALLALLAVGTFVAMPRVGASGPLPQVASPGHLVRAMPTIHDARIPLGTNGDCVLPVVIAVTCVGVGEPMTYGGGPIQPDAAVYIVYWGWNGNDPSGEAAYQQAFFDGLGGSAWAGTQTQYCDATSDPVGLNCAAGATHVGNPTGLLKGTWSDNTDPIPTSPTDADIQAEAVRAAAHFGNTSAAANASTQYIIDTPHGNSTSGFGTQWCAYHGSAGSSYGALSYTDFPYITDAGASCGENFVNAGPAGLLDGVSIVGGHEFAESETDPSPPSGWTDLAGAETGDKCAWIQLGPGASADVTLSTGTFAVQSLWSNAANGGLGGCSLG
jgi:serine protease